MKQTKSIQLTALSASWLCGIHQRPHAVCGLPFADHLLSGEFLRTNDEAEHPCHGGQRGRVGQLELLPPRRH